MGHIRLFHKFKDIYYFSTGNPQFYAVFSIKILTSAKKRYIIISRFREMFYLRQLPKDGISSQFALFP